MEASFISSFFAAAKPYSQYLLTGNPEQQRRWTAVYEKVAITEAQKTLLGGFVREMKILIVSGIWCGDCVQQCPLIARIAEANPTKIDLRFVDRDAAKELSAKVKINGGSRVPVVLFLAEDCEICCVYGDRTISRYRALAMKALGAACSTGIVGPDKDELTATLADWVTETERAQLMLRLSPRLREKYND